MPVEEITLDRPDGPAFVRRAPAVGPTETLLLHSLPTSSDDMVPLLTACGGIAPDLQGFGRSSKAGHLDSTLDALATFVGALLDELQVESVRLVGHGWGGAVGLVLAQREPERFERLVLLNPLPLHPGFAWERMGTLLQRPLLGELTMGAVPKRTFAKLLRRGSATPEAWDDSAIASVWEQFDQGTQRAVLRLFRDATPERLVLAGAGMEQLSMPALVLWGERDPWFPAPFGDAYAARLGDATLERLPAAGHWPWRDDPAVIQRVAGFLAG